MSKKPIYDESSIQSLDWKEHIRYRPGMYIGKLGNGKSPDDGIYVLLKEIIEQIYGVSFDKPPIKSFAYLPDEIIKLNFQKKTKLEWYKISKKFEFNSIIVPSNWKISLSPVLESKNYSLYILY